MNHRDAMMLTFSGQDDMGAATVELSGPVLSVTLEGHLVNVFRGIVITRLEARGINFSEKDAPFINFTLTNVHPLAIPDRICDILSPYVSLEEVCFLYDWGPFPEDPNGPTSVVWVSCREWPLPPTLHLRSDCMVVRLEDLAATKLFELVVPLHGGRMADGGWGGEITLTLTPHARADLLNTLQTIVRCYEG